MPTAATEISVTAPARLHFGLIPSLGGSGFGGLGLMICSPETVVHCRSSARFTASGNYSNLVTGIANRFAAKYQSAVKQAASQRVLPPVEIELARSAPRHCGLGSGTQIAFAVAAALFRFFDFEVPSAMELATLTGRARRSAIGSVGFFEGGQLFDSGANDPCCDRLDFPEQWPILLIRDPAAGGTHGESEEQFFRSNQNDADQRSQVLLDICQSKIVPAVEKGSYSEFASSLYDFNRRSGEYFAAMQGGPFSEPCRPAVRLLRSIGVEATGQSSWGPTVFAVLKNQQMADEVAGVLHQQHRAGKLYQSIEITQVAACNHGARVCQ